MKSKLTTVEIILKNNEDECAIKNNIPTQYGFSYYEAKCAQGAVVADGDTCLYEASGKWDCAPKTGVARCEKGLMKDFPQCASGSPSLSPTYAPSPGPTLTPTIGPTKRGDTFSPSMTPTKSTFEPTIGPTTPFPTSAPTVTFYQTFSDAPTEYVPTNAPPSKSPTAKPSRAPTTRAPTTRAPTGSPSWISEALESEGEAPPPEQLNGLPEGCVNFMENIVKTVESKLKEYKTSIEVGQSFKSRKSFTSNEYEFHIQRVRSTYAELDFPETSLLAAKDFPSQNGGIDTVRMINMRKAFQSLLTEYQNEVGIAGGDKAFNVWLFDKTKAVIDSKAGKSAASEVPPVAPAGDDEVGQTLDILVTYFYERSPSCLGSFVISPIVSIHVEDACNETKVMGDCQEIAPQLDYDMALQSNGNSPMEQVLPIEEPSLPTKCPDGSLRKDLPAKLIDAVECAWYDPLAKDWDASQCYVTEVFYHDFTMRHYAKCACKQIDGQFAVLVKDMTEDDVTQCASYYGSGAFLAPMVMYLIVFGYVLFQVAHYVSNNDTSFCTCQSKPNFQAPLSHLLLVFVAGGRVLQCLFMVNTFQYAAMYPMMNGALALGSTWVVATSSFGYVSLLKWTTGTQNKYKTLGEKVAKPLVGAMVLFTLLSMAFFALGLVSADLQTALDQVNAGCLVAFGIGFIVSICGIIVISSDKKIFAESGAHQIDIDVGEEDEDKMHEDDHMYESEEQMNKRIDEFYPKTLGKAKFGMIQGAASIMSNCLLLISAVAMEVLLKNHTALMVVYLLFDVFVMACCLAIFSYHLKHYKSEHDLHADEFLDEDEEMDDEDDFADFADDGDKKKKSKKNKKTKKKKAKKKDKAQDVEEDFDFGDEEFDDDDGGDEDKKKKKKKDKKKKKKSKD